jgi:hypothetical protein
MKHLTLAGAIRFCEIWVNPANYFESLLEKTTEAFRENPVDTLEAIGRYVWTEHVMWDVSQSLIRILPLLPRDRHSELVRTLLESFLIIDIHRDCALTALCKLDDPMSIPVLAEAKELDMVNVEAVQAHLEKLYKQDDAELD